MQRYILLRILQSIISIFAVSIIIFMVGRVVGDPASALLPPEATLEEFDRVNAAWGLDKPLVVQYGKYIGNAFKGDFGESWKWQGYTAGGLIADRFPATAELAALALAMGLFVAIPLGVISSVRKDTPFDYLGKTVALIGQSVPAFWMGIVMIWLFAVELEWLPTSGRGGWKTYILPAVAMGWFQVAAFMRLIRSAMLDVLDSEYVKLARIKGVAEWKVVWKHCLRNAAIAPLTYFGIILGTLMAGSVAIETVFTWPGVGLLAVDAVRSRDYQVLQTVVIMFSAIYIAANLTVDVLYAYLDPRIRYQ
ncbi:MAG: ABC transporter permease [Dehalococcoidia bacterium]|nr:ABC transporter permease [Dehalococcoidia bacterium]